eukprot:sb/3474924/
MDKSTVNHCNPGDLSRCPVRFCPVRSFCYFSSNFSSSCDEMTIRYISCISLVGYVVHCSILLQHFIRSEVLLTLPLFHFDKMKKWQNNSRKLTVFDPDIPGTPVYRAKPFPPSIPVSELRLYIYKTATYICC